MDGMDEQVGGEEEKVGAAETGQQVVEDIPHRPKGSSPIKKTVKKADIVCFGRPSPPKRVKSGHLLSDYRQKCVNGTRDILMLKP